MSGQHSKARKLSPAQVRRLREMRAQGFTRAFLAQSFGLSLNAVHQILAFSSYKDVR
jgi:hypothetical protein